MRTLISSTFLYACESWTLSAKIKITIQTLEVRCYRRLLNISYKDHVTTGEVRSRIQNTIGVHDDLLSMEKKRKVRWHGHISRTSGMAKAILQRTVKEQEREGDRKRDGKIISKNGQKWDLEIPWGQRKTYKGGMILLQHQLWCADDHQY